jgi:rod shape-determining protein MreC
MSIKDFWINIKDIRKLSEINKALEKENRKLISQNSNLKELKNENEILRAQLGFIQEHPEYKLVAAEVIGRDPNNFLQFMTINKGSRDGIKKDMPVISEGYLVGKIFEVDKTNSKVLLITNPSSIVNALIQESRATGIIKGELGYSLTIESISQEAKVELGDTVITSGLGGTFPKGLIIGEIIQIEKKEAEVFKKAQVSPLVDFTSLEVVFVITN